jgi:hypothetical protein
MCGNSRILDELLEEISVNGRGIFPVLVQARRPCGAVGVAGELENTLRLAAAAGQLAAVRCRRGNRCQGVRAIDRGF